MSDTIHRLSVINPNNKNATYFYWEIRL